MKLVTWIYNYKQNLQRVIQKKKLLPLGGEKSIPVDFRLIAATNLNLSAEVKKEILEDLFFRLNVVNIEAPPLKSKEDIPCTYKTFYK